MLDVVRNETPRNFCLPFERTSAELTSSPELELLSRQTYALEYIATQLGVLTTHTGRAIELPVELQPEYELATRRLLQEAI